MSDEFTPPAFGWVNDPQEVAMTVAALEAQQGAPIALGSAAPELVAEADDDTPAFYWLLEEKVLGRVLPTWDQGPDGTCVSFGFGRNAQDLLLAEIAAGEAEEWPGAEIATEPIYGGSRVEVGGGRIRGAGSVGAWAAKWVKDWGVLPRGVYGRHDLTRYSIPMSREWGERGVPDDLEPKIREHPVTAVAMVTTAAEGWAAVGAYKPVPVCSMQGFTTRLDSEGFCQPRGQWAHCMATRGRFVHPDRGRSVVIGNSWGDYMPGGTLRFVDPKDGGKVKTVQLPPGHFACKLSEWAGMLAQRDSFTLAGLTGWARVSVDIDYTP